MKIRRAIIVSLVFAAAFAAACARKTVVIENRYTRGEELTYRLTTKGSGTTSMTGFPGLAEGGEMPITLDMELVYRTVVKSVDAQGTAEVEAFFNRFSSLNESGGFKVRIEADEKGTRIVQGETVLKDAPGLDGLKAFFATPTVFTANKRGAVLSVIAPAAAGTILPQMDLNIFLKQGQFLLPEGPIAVGGSWNEKLSIAPGETPGGASPGAGSFTMDTRYTLTGVTKRGGRQCAEITLRGEMDMKDVAINPPGAAAQGLRMKTVFDRLKQTNTGTILFDLAKGRLVEMHMDAVQDFAVTKKMSTEGPEVKLTETKKIKTSSDLKLME